METKDYTTTINVQSAPIEAFLKISTVNGWWAKNLTGSALNEGDTFKVQFGTTWVDFKVTESVPGKKLTWQVTNCHLDWLKDKTEWNDTKVLWEILPSNGGSQIVMTHVGLQPWVECYEVCEAGWNGHVAESLVEFLNGEKGKPQ